MDKDAKKVRRERPKSAAAVKAKATTARKPATRTGDDDAPQSSEARPSGRAATHRSTASAGKRSTPTKPAGKTKRSRAVADHGFAGAPPSQAAASSRTARGGDDKSQARRAAAKPDDSLAEYARKRDFDKTPEPGPEVARPSAQPIFVVQEHHATRLHWDLRLEAGGVLKSFAVTREPTPDPSVKRLAVQTEDHPLAYAKFHGDIPAGEYGAGHMEIWDHGTYTPPRGAADVGAGLAAGKVDFELHGQKLRGSYALVRMAGRGRGENWLLIKKKDRFAAASGSGEDGKSDAKQSATPPKAKRAAPKLVTPAAKGEPRDVQFTNVGKMMYPEAGVTKGDVLKFYLEIAPLLLPHLRDRPVTLERLPDGVGEGRPRFWQKNTPDYYPSWVPRVELPTERGKSVRYALVNDTETLAYLVNQGALTFHTYLSRVGDLDRPDFVVFDLDPGNAAFVDVVRIAQALHAILDEAGAASFPKTSGKSGLHVLVPWRQAGGYDAARAWAMGLAERVVAELPKLATVERLKDRRDGRVYVDVIQNAAGHHVVPPYILRATPGATASTPLEWKEVTPKLDPRRFTIGELLKRATRRKDLMAPLVSGGNDQGRMQE